jgi:hypothetical protein
MAMPLSAVGDKWKARVGQSKQYYTDGTKNAAAKYDQGVSNAEPAWEQGVNSAITNKSYQKGVSGKGSVYAAKASTIGSDRWAQGVNGADQKYVQNFTPYYQAETTTDFGPKGAKGSEANLQRARNAAQMLHAMKLSK